ncbi:MAG: hypothetical protein ACLVEV_03865 [Lachnospiraceae bacterium]
MIWNTGYPSKSGTYITLLEDGEEVVAKYFRCQMTGQCEWSRFDGEYIYDNIIGWLPYDGS